VFPFDAVADRIQAADISVGNLECVPSPIGRPVQGIYPLRAPVAALTVLKNAGFDILSVANNHARDLGAEGRDDMLRRLRKAQFGIIGEQDAMPQAPSPVVQQVKGIHVGFIAYFNIDPKRAARETALAKQGLDILVVFNHWGYEGKPDILEEQRSLGHAMIDSGADIVVGTHAHVVQPDEWYKNGYLAYGLGNFVFPGMSHRPNQDVGVLLEITVDKGGVVDRTVRRVRLNEMGVPAWTNEEPNHQRKPDRTGQNGHPDGVQPNTAVSRARS